MLLCSGIMEEFKDSPVSPNPPQNKTLRSNAIQRKINELMANNEKTLQATQEVLAAPITPTHLAPPRKISGSQLSGSLPNISFANFPGDLLPHYDTRSSPSPMRHERSASPRTVPFPCGGHSPRHMSRTPDMAGSPNQNGLPLPFPPGYAPARTNSHSNLLDLPSPGALSPLADPSLVTSLHPPVLRKRSSSYSPITTLSPEEEMSLSYSMNLGRQITIPVPNVPGPWNSKPVVPQFSPHSIPIPSQFRNRKCGCAGAPNPLQLQMPAHSHNGPDQSGYNGSPFQSTQFLPAHSIPSQHYANGQFSRSSSSSSFDAVNGYPPLQANNNNANLNPAGFDGVPTYIPPAFSPSASMANLTLDCGYTPTLTDSPNIQSIQSPPSYQPDVFPMGGLSRMSFSEPVMHQNRIDFQNNYNNIPSVIITEPNDALNGPLSPATEEALNNIFVEFLGIDPEKAQQLESGIPSDLDIAIKTEPSSQMADMNIDDDLAILNEIALRELHSPGNASVNWIR
ncbi:CREB-regulated transcription coactivator 1 homolog [Paramacrobiotus metropolitanus]|uniref:CREB-regulated transcription coactivator 1 homolog n=1 Tax=Paramacrobiotus metropolitanus TaxID=2943436 RepID=UPI00244643CA|nr:CREB-regulated transcription coactivator 1 homolog [Paramacrobiotus metropolitanus]